MVRRNVIGEEEIKRMRVIVLVDTGSLYIAINENIQEQLQLPVVDKRKAQLADGSIIECDVVAPVEVKFKNRSTTCRAMVLPGNSEPHINKMLIDDAPVTMPYYRIIS